MDRLIHDLYKYKIIQIKKTELKKWSYSAFSYKPLGKIFDYPYNIRKFFVRIK